MTRAAARRECKGWFRYAVAIYSALFKFHLNSLRNCGLFDFIVWQFCLNSLGDAVRISLCGSLMRLNVFFVVTIISFINKRAICALKINMGADNQFEMEDILNL